MTSSSSQLVESSSSPSVPPRSLLGSPDEYTFFCGSQHLSLEVTLLLLSTRLPLLLRKLLIPILQAGTVISCCWSPRQIRDFLAIALAKVGGVRRLFCSWYLPTGCGINCWCCCWSSLLLSLLHFAPAVNSTVGLCQNSSKIHRVAFWCCYQQSRKNANRKKRKRHFF